MNDISQVIIIKNSLIKSMEKEDLLLVKYEEYLSLTDKVELNDLIKEFRDTSEAHMDMLQDKMEKFRS